VTIEDTAPDLAVTKTAAPSALPEPGGIVTFTVRVENVSNSEDPVTLTALMDDRYGDLTDISDEGGSAEIQLTTSCSLPQVIAPAAAYQCDFTVQLVGNGADVFTDSVTATVEDDDGAIVSESDAESVTLTNVLPVIRLTKTPSPLAVFEPGANVAFAVVVNNDSIDSDPVTLNSLTDDLYGNVASLSNPALVSTTCSLPQPIAPGASYSCSFVAFVSGNAGDSIVNSLTAGARDDESTLDTSAAQATVIVGDTAPAVTVLKSAVPASVAEPGGVVTFTIEVSNVSVVTDPVTVTSLVDDLYGDLDGRGDCVLPQVVPSGASYSCSFPVVVRGVEGDPEVDTVTVSVVDDEGTVGGGGDSETVSITECVQPTLLLSGQTVSGLHFEGACDTIEAGPAYTVEGGGDVTFAAGSAIVLKDGFSVLTGGRFVAELTVP
jgi:hypothetical protein